MEMASLAADRVLLLGPLQVIQNRTQLPLPPSRKLRARSCVPDSGADCGIPVLTIDAANTPIAGRKFLAGTMCL